MIELIIEDSMLDMTIQWNDKTTLSTHFTYDLVGLMLQVKAWNQSRRSLNPVRLSAKCNSDTAYEVKEIIRRALHPDPVEAIVFKHIVDSLPKFEPDNGPFFEIDE